MTFQSNPNSIPKRATQHGLFLSGSEAPIVTLKPGQKELHRNGFYTTETKALEETYIAQDQFKKSVYAKHTSELTQPVDYMDPQKPIRPVVSGGKTDADKQHGAAHWRTEYKNTFSEAGKEGHMPPYKRQIGPPFEIQNPPACVSQPNELSFYQHEFGVYGSDPRHRISKQDTVLVTRKTDLTRGTTKGTTHIPGYQGFIPTNTNNPKVAEIEKGDKIRGNDKNNLVEIYHLNIPGYAGHVPVCAQNDKGPRQISTMTIHGKDYSTTAGLAF